MNTLKTIAALSTLALAYNVSAAPLDMNISTVGDAAYITVTENGQPAVGVPVSVESVTSARTLKTSADGSVIVRNYDNNAATYTFSVTEDDGSVLSTKRLLSR